MKVKNSVEQAICLLIIICLCPDWCWLSRNIPLKREFGVHPGSVLKISNIYLRHRTPGLLREIHWAIIFSSYFLM